MYSHCTTGGWILGNSIDGTQAEYVRIPHADTSFYPIPKGVDEVALVMLSDILPTGFECGVLNGKAQPGSIVAIVGSGPIGLASPLTAQFYSPAQIIMIDLDDHRLEVAKRFGATATIKLASCRGHASSMAAKPSPPPRPAAMQLATTRSNTLRKISLSRNRSLRARANAGGSGILSSILRPQNQR